MTAFDLDVFLSMPRVDGLALSPDGSRLVTSVATVGPDGKRFLTGLWQLDPQGSAQPRRLTRSAKGESAPAFLPDGSLLFTSGRPDPEARKEDDDGEEDRAALWLLPSGGGEARLVAGPPGGVGDLAVARDSGLVAIAVDVFPDAPTLDDDRDRFKVRKKAGVTAQLFEQYPIRFWDHYLGPRERRIYVADPPGDPLDGRLGELRQAADGAGRALDEVSFDLTPDGSTLVTGRRRPPRAPGCQPELAVDLVAIDVATGEQRVLAAGEFFFSEVACSPDGRFAVAVREDLGTPELAGGMTLWLVDLASGEGRELTPDLGLFPYHPAWSSDSRRVFFVADQEGRAPLFGVDVASGTVTRLAAAGAFAYPCPAPGGTAVFALRSMIDAPPHAVRLEAGHIDQDPVVLPTPGSPVEVPGRLEEVGATASDGTHIRSWLVMPAGASAGSPAPLVVWIHGGPFASWNAWHWRWCPWLLAERGYAILLPDPALSTGYGHDFVQRGYGRWGEAPYTDVLVATDAACGRPDVDETRTAAMGGSFGGYMANWVAGHTDRFRCIVTHASLWALDQFHGTTDDGVWWEREFGDPYADPSRYVESSPHRHVGSIRTPMLVIHGEQDHRVPVGEALRLWTDLVRHGVPAKFLYFPDENHWVLKPQHARVWYETVFAWLDHHVLGKDWQRPPLL
jgi:dipeptidyl aminopeptidase/acylaminoacyl peptidase